MSDPRFLLAITRRMLLQIAAACALAMAPGNGALAADPPIGNAVKGKPMNMDEPMAGGMKKEGMKKGDVRKAAEKKDREMRETIEKERQSARAPNKN